MGYLHKGHLELIKSSVNQNDITVCSIFVNPIQFNNPEDLKKYPHSIEKDIDMLKEASVSTLFHPGQKEMYPQKPETGIDFGRIGNILEGKFRPGHFNGVGLVVAKLFNIVRPDIAYFGEKDLQQLVIIRKLVADLNFKIKIEGIPTLRETSGLAMSSRNARLNSEDLESASLIYNSLKLAKKLLDEGATVEKALDGAVAVLNRDENISTEYINVVDLGSFEIIETGRPDKDVALCAAAFVGGVRLIDNIICKSTRRGEI
jgi:pantoate--beta-alanine ligase